MENCLYYDAIHDFSVWLRTGSDPADINQFRSHNGKEYIFNNHSMSVCLTGQIYHIHKFRETGCLCKKSLDRFGSPLQYEASYRSYYGL